MMECGVKNAFESCYRYGETVERHIDFTLFLFLKRENKNVRLIFGEYKEKQCAI